MATVISLGGAWHRGSVLLALIGGAQRGDLVVGGWLDLVGEGAQVLGPLGILARLRGVVLVLVARQRGHNEFGRHFVTGS